MSPQGSFRAGSLRQGKRLEEPPEGWISWAIDITKTRQSAARARTDTECWRIRRNKAIVLDWGDQEIMCDSTGGCATVTIIFRSRTPRPGRRLPITYSD